VNNAEFGVALYSAKHKQTGEIKYFSSAGALRVFLSKNEDWILRRVIQ